MAAVGPVAGTGVELLVIVRVAFATAPGDGVPGRHCDEIGRIRKNIDGVMICLLVHSV